MQQAGHHTNPTAMLALFCIHTLLTHPWLNHRMGVIFAKKFP